MTLREAFTGGGAAVLTPPVTEPEKPPVTKPLDDPIAEIAGGARYLISDYNNWTTGIPHTKKVLEITEGVFIKKRHKVVVDQWCITGAINHFGFSREYNEQEVVGTLMALDNYLYLRGFGRSVISFNDQARSREHHKKVLTQLDAFIASRERRMEVDA